jgi:hypothetical protein
LTVVIAVAPIVAAEPVDYSRDIAPLFRKYCNGCHNTDEHEGELNLQSHALALAGGASGKVIVPGDAANSLLVHLISGNEEPAMPPEDEAQPTAEEIALITRWVSEGAKGPAGDEPDSTSLDVPKITPQVPVVDAVGALALSPDGATVAVGRYGTVELTRRADSAVVKTLAGHRGRVTFLSFTADGKHLLAAAGEPGLFGEVRLWDVSTGELLKTFTGHRDSLYAAVVSPDGKTLATSSYDQTIKLWDIAAGNELATLTGHNDAVYDLAFRPDGKVLASASGDRTVKLWSVPSGDRLDTLSQALQELYTVAFSPDGKRLYAGGVDNRIRVWSISESANENTNPQVASPFAHEEAILKLVVSADGSLLVSASEDHKISLWDAHSLALRGTLEQQPDWPAAIAMTADKSTLLVGRMDGTLSEYPLSGLGEATVESPRQPTFAPLAWYGEQPPIDQLPKTAEVEPNDTIATSTTMSVPGVATGKIQPAEGAARDIDLFRFSTKAGEQWLIETNAARSKSKLDSRIEVLDAPGRPIERALLRAVYQSEVEFRGADSSQRGFRFAGWEDMHLNDLIYLEGEVVKLVMQRRGPDADAQVYPVEGSRHAFFDTSPRTHALGLKCYIVEPYPPGTKLGFNGLPVFPLHYENDDDGLRKLGTDSRVNFTAPADGEYLVRVTDVRGFSGDEYSYQLVVRRPQPDFSATVALKDLTVAAGSGRRLTVKVDRTDGFWGEVRVDIEGMPPGFYVSSPIVVQAGHESAHGVLFAHPNAPAPTDENAAATKIVATANVAGREVQKTLAPLGKIAWGTKPKIVLMTALDGQSPEPPSADANGELKFPQPIEVTIAPGGSATFQLVADRGEFPGIINLVADNLPHGVIVDNIGLNGIQLLENDTSRTLYLSAEKWVPEQDRMFYLHANEEGGQASFPVLLKVRQNK